MFLKIYSPKYKHLFEKEAAALERMKVKGIVMSKSSAEEQIIRIDKIIGPSFS